MQNSLTQLLIILIITAVITLVIKNITKVPRPKNAVVKLVDYAFPSGHTSISFALATFYTFFIKDLSINLIDKIILILGIYTAVIFIVYWRLQIKVHTPFQIFIGALLGSLISMVVVLFVK
jgi:membrane-associated phospholipid phosphatase